MCALGVGSHVPSLSMTGPPCCPHIITCTFPVPSKPPPHPLVLILAGTQDTFWVPLDPGDIFLLAESPRTPKSQLSPPHPGPSLGFPCWPLGTADKCVLAQAGGSPRGHFQPQLLVLLQIKLGFLSRTCN